MDSQETQLVNEISRRVGYRVRENFLPGMAATSVLINNITRIAEEELVKIIEDYIQEAVPGTMVLFSEEFVFHRITIQLDGAPAIHISFKDYFRKQGPLYTNSGSFDYFREVVPSYRTSYEMQIRDKYLFSPPRALYVATCSITMQDCGSGLSHPPISIHLERTPYHQDLVLKAKKDLRTLALTGCVGPLYYEIDERLPVLISQALHCMRFEGEYEIFKTSLGTVTWSSMQILPQRNI